MKLFIHHPIFRIVVPFVVGGLAYLFTLLAFERITEIQESFAMSEWLLCTGLSYLLLEGLRILHLVNDRYTFMGQSISAKLWTQFGLNLFFSLFFIGLGISAYFIFYLDFRNLSSFYIEMWTINIIFTFITLAYTSAVNSISVLKTQNEVAWEEANIRQQQLNLNLIRYNQEIQPELLYNGLETVIPFLYEDQTTADELILKLSEVYRYQLEKRQEDLVRLSDELRVVKAWLYIWSQRYPDQIKWEHHLEQSHLNALILPGSLTNCIAYLMEQTLFSQLQPLNIQIYTQGETLWIAVGKNDRLTQTISKHHSLEAIKQCYIPFTAKEIKEEVSSTNRKIGLPLLSFSSVNQSI